MPTYCSFSATIWLPPWLNTAGRPSMKSAIGSWLCALAPRVMSPLNVIRPLAWNGPSPSKNGRVHAPPNDSVWRPCVQSKSSEIDGVVV